MLSKFAYVENNYGISSLTQLKDIWRLWRTNSLLPNEYFDFSLFSYDINARRNFIGLVESNKIWSRYNVKPSIEKYINNKWKFYHKFVDLPIPETGLLQRETINDQIKEIYEISRHTNVFMKPVAGWGGKGCFVITNKMDFNAVIGCLLRNYSAGYIYQRALKPHHEMDKFTYSGAIGALRVITLVRQPDKIEIVGAFTKFVGQGNIVDYTSNPGNYLVGVYPHFWSLTEAMTNNGVNSKRFNEMNGYSIYGTNIPVGEDFDSELCRWVSEVHNKLELDTSLIGWDIAVTNEGVYCLEANLKPGFASLQKADGKGYLHVFNPQRVLSTDYTPIKSFAKKGLTTAWKTR